LDIPPKVSLIYFMKILMNVKPAKTNQKFWELPAKTILTLQLTLLTSGNKIIDLPSK